MMKAKGRKKRLLAISLLILAISAMAGTFAWHASSSAKNIFTGSKQDKTVEPEGKVMVGEVLTYKISYSYQDDDESIVITDTIPEGTEYVGGSATKEGELRTDVANQDGEKKTGLVWNLKKADDEKPYEVTFQVKVTEDALKNADGEVTNTAKIGDNWSSTTHNGVEGKTSKIISEDDGDEKTSYNEGDIIEYTIKYYNDTDENATITITDDIPEGTKYESSDQGGKLSEDKTRVTWTLTDVEPGESGYVHLKVRVAVDDKDYIDNVAVIDKNKTNVVVDTKKKTVDKKGLVTVGDLLTYTVKYDESDFADGTELTITDKVPDGTELNKLIAGKEYAQPTPDAYNEDRKEITWKIPKSESSSGEVSFQVKVTEDALIKAGGIVTNIAKVGDHDTNKVSNGVEGKTIVEKEDGKDETNSTSSYYQPGEELTYRIWYYNDQDEPADIKITDQLPSGTEFVKATPEQEDYDEETRTVTWKLTSVEPHKQGSVTVTVKVNGKNRRS